MGATVNPNTSRLADRYHLRDFIDSVGEDTIQMLKAVPDPEEEEPLINLVRSDLGKLDVEMRAAVGRFELNPILRKLMVLK